LTVANTPATGLGNVGRALRFRESVSLLLRAEGVQNTVAPMHRTLAASFDPSNPASDILGIPRFSILTRSEVQRDLSGGVNAAVIAARDDGAEYGVAIWDRHLYSASEAYVVTTLDQFAKIIRAVNP
jgi:hypothetical protein